MCYKLIEDMDDDLNQAAYRVAWKHENFHMVIGCFTGRKYWMNPEPEPSYFLRFRKKPYVSRHTMEPSYVL